MRRNDIDALRIFATFTLFIFHSAMIFNPAPFFHIRNDEVSIVFLIVCGFISLWHMPLFFFLAGWSLFHSIAGRGAGGVVRERLRRIGIPLVLGSAVFGPPIKYLELKSGLDFNHAGFRVREDLQDSFREVIPSGLDVMPAFDESFTEFLPTFFTNVDRFSWSHLWFIAYLLTFTLLYLPLLARFARTPKAHGQMKAQWLYAPIALLALIQMTLRPHWPGIQNLYNDWANVAYYSTFLFLGFAFARRPDLERLAHTESKRALAIGLGACGVLLLAVAEIVTSSDIVLAMTAVAGWCFIIAILGFAHARFTVRTQRSAYLSSAAFPIYVLHQPAIVFIGYPIVALTAGIAVKFALVTTLALAATMLLYHGVVRRCAALRTATGMDERYSMTAKTRRTPPAPPAAAAILMVAMLLTSSLAQASGPTPLGLWWAEGGTAKVRIEHCGDVLCGRVEWLHAPLGRDGCRLRDEHNPSARLRERAVEGLRILSDLQLGDDRRTWKGGNIYDPGSGRTYSCTLEMVDKDTLEIRGYVGIPLLGRTTAWHRVGSLGRMCALDQEDLE